jgi:hypothetical protein
MHRPTYGDGGPLGYPVLAVEIDAPSDYCNNRGMFHVLGVTLAPAKYAELASSAVEQRVCRPTRHVPADPKRPSASVDSQHDRRRVTHLEIAAILRLPKIKLNFSSQHVAQLPRRLTVAAVSDARGIGP